MGYMHIDNLYRPEAQTILLFKECYALEKIHGTSAHISWRDGQLTFFPGGEKMTNFLALFDVAALAATFVEMGHPEVTVFGEAYGGKQQGQKWRYGDKLKFVVFDVQVGETWLSVPSAHDVAVKLGLEFVHYKLVKTDLTTLDDERDAPSEQARRNGVDELKSPGAIDCPAFEGLKHHGLGSFGCAWCNGLRRIIPREGVVLRPLLEFKDHRGHRIIAKHKRAEERETKKPREVAPGKMEVLHKAEEIAEEWVTEIRLQHVLDHLGNPDSMSAAPFVIAAMVEDVTREGAGEFEDTKEARRAIGTRAAKLFKKHLQAKLAEVQS